MRRFLTALIFFVAALPAHAWNAAGHRLVAVIAWQQLSPPARTAISAALARHPDHTRWQASARSSDAGELFAEAATWPDDIRNDPRFFDEDRDPPTPALPGFPDTARHKRWHYVDLDAAGKVQSGELDRQIERLSKLLKTSRNAEQITYALPWLLHLVGDIHQPLHVGRHGDEGGNQVEIENPFNKRLPFSSLHLYWDDLPGPPWLRGQRLDDIASRLLARYPAPEQGNASLWRQESHDLLATAYPGEQGSLLPIIDEDFQRASRNTANRRLVAAGYRLGRLLDGIFDVPVSGARQ
ncbi:S1/P1 nuclease [Dechloromonas sp. XY25]|uniref:S1/P1 nuclease n=1 Tax=Dechloromonas hankyongensis TaxID=2908002 RepID=A0ABS9JY65_9RHOO|nr:S1/P1 nuclease [Dechloromonas hankyongensis]MCG2575838.1 S1/P1 nuclease [Dechloromonas hankyongensis]